MLLRKGTKRFTCRLQWSNSPSRSLLPVDVSVCPFTHALVPGSFTTGTAAAPPPSPPETCRRKLDIGAPPESTIIQYIVTIAQVGCVFHARISQLGPRSRTQYLVQLRVTGALFCHSQLVIRIVTLLVYRSGNRRLVKWLTLYERLRNCI